MERIALFLGATVAAILLFTFLNYFIKRYKKPSSAQQGIWNAVYFLQLKQYQRALELLDATEQEFAMTPEVMCDLCIQRAAAHRGLEQYDEATAAYDVLFEALGECEGNLKRNDDLLKEIKTCYEKCGRLSDFEKWEKLFYDLT